MTRAHQDLLCISKSILLVFATPVIETMHSIDTQVYARYLGACGSKKLNFVHYLYYVLVQAYHLKASVIHIVSLLAV